MNTEIKKKLFNSWYPLLKPLVESDYFEKLIKFLDKEYKNPLKNIHPQKKNIFRAFQLTDYRKLRVIILGMDPYNTPNGKANGLAFANSEGSGALSPSLRKIWEVIEDDYSNGLRLDFDPTLEGWAKQGVLLINTALTVEEGEAGSHSKPWNEFTTKLLELLSVCDSGIIYCLWGKNAQDYTQYINTDTNYVLYAEHPSYAARKGRKWEFSFKFIDKLNMDLNGETIKW